MTRTRQPHIDRCFDIDEATSVPPPRTSSEQQAAPGYGKRVDVKRLAAVSEGGYWWNSTTQELIEICLSITPTVDKMRRSSLKRSAAGME